jgi:hypothetical protein
MSKVTLELEICDTRLIADALRETARLKEFSAASPSCPNLKTSYFYKMQAATMRGLAIYVEQTGKAA